MMLKQKRKKMSVIEKKLMTEKELDEMVEYRLKDTMHKRKARFELTQNDPSISERTKAFWRKKDEKTMSNLRSITKADIIRENMGIPDVFERLYDKPVIRFHFEVEVDKEALRKVTDELKSILLANYPNYDMNGFTKAKIERVSKLCFEYRLVVGTIPIPERHKMTSVILENIRTFGVDCMYFSWDYKKSFAPA